MYQKRKTPSVEGLVAASLYNQDVNRNLEAVNKLVSDLAYGGKEMQSLALQEKQYMAAEATLDLITESANLKHADIVCSVAVGVGAHWDRLACLVNGYRTRVSLSKLKSTVHRALRSSERMLDASKILIEERGTTAAAERVRTALKELEKDLPGAR